MASIQDDRGYNQGFKESYALTVRTNRRCERMIQEMEISDQTQILELGCGTGELSYMLASKTKAHVTGSDLCIPFIEQARVTYQKPNLSYEVFKVDGQRAPSKKYDYIVGNGILHHVVDHLDSILPQLRSQLKKGGKLVFWEPNIYNPYVFLIFKFPALRRAAKLEPDEMAFGRSFIKRKLKMAGFNHIDISYSDFLLPNTPTPLVGIVSAIGDAVEKIPVVDHFAQSLFISAQTE